MRTGRGWRRAAVVALLTGLVALAAWGEKLEEQDPQWFAPKEPVTLYFATPDAMGLGAEVRWLPPSQAGIEGRLRALVEGPRSPGLRPTLSPRVTVRSVRVQEDTVVVDFDRTLVREHPGGSAGEILTVYSVVNTLTEIPGIRRVAWLIEGMPVETLVGHLDLTRPVEREPSLISGWEAGGGR